MLILTKNKFLFYRQYKLDIWGVFKSSLILRLHTYDFEEDELSWKYKFWKDQFVSKKIDWICRFFCEMYTNKFFRKWKTKRYIYRLDVIEPEFTRKKKKRKFFVGLKLFQMFYLTLSIKRIQKFVRFAKKLDGLYESNLLFFLEFRLLSLLYRISLLSNIFESINIIKNGFICVGDSYIKFPNKFVSMFTIVRVDPFLKGFVYWNYFRRLKRRALFCSIPRYLFFSFQFLFFFACKVPKEKDLINPFPLDIIKIAGFTNIK